MKYNETEDEKKARLLRSLNALKACNIGVPSSFRGLKVGDPLNIEYYEAQGEEEEPLDVTEAEVIVVKKGRTLE
jgi:hypothetical protein